MIDGGYDIDLEAVNQNVEEAEVVTFYFPMLRRTLLVDTRCGPQEGPLVCVVGMVDNSTQRYESLRRLRPQLPRPASLSMIPWAHSVGSLESTGVWERIIQRLLQCGGPEVLIEAGRCLRELHTPPLNNSSGT